MKKYIIIVLLFLSLFAFADEGRPEKPFRLSVNVLGGGRYDNLRMCVASPAGVPGGPVADVMAGFYYQKKENLAFGFKLPVFRPLLFAAAFKMLQFEPEFVLDYGVKLSEKVQLALVSGLGVSLHYGPDYHSERSGTGRTEDFFSAGPMISQLVGIKWINRKGKQGLIGLRFFYTPLFSQDRGVGTVLGAALEARFDVFAAGKR